MAELLIDHYLWIKAFHIISIIAWMAGLLYLPRLFVYHCSTKIGSEFSEKLKIMEYRLMVFIMAPARISSLFFGLLLFLSYSWEELIVTWVVIKLICVVFLFIIHDLFNKWRKDFQTDTNIHQAKFFRIMNEVPTLLMIFIVIFVVVKPF
ncbi:MAG: TIGR00701 family protein [Rhodospirillaceae bacterium]|nr:TIGR00701 family protein [Rhodospirillaceae bacterium]MAV88969.1 TIGR00701 family protein [Rhodospirillaceae bacterium]OUT77414.1 MAG: TIGR00701 family protein [Rhodospirillaceae bacterium TMED23]